MKISRKEFLMAAVGLWAAGCGTAQTVRPTSEGGFGGDSGKGHTTSPHGRPMPEPVDECVDWSPTGECIDWDTPPEPVDECVKWSPSGECVEWEPMEPYGE